MTTVTRGTLVINREQCKGCELCVVACPKQVLSMSDEVNEVGYRFPLLSPGCIGCRVCHDVCPDSVFDVYRYDEPLRADAEAGSESPS